MLREIPYTREGVRRVLLLGPLGEFVDDYEAYDRDYSRDSDVLGRFFSGDDTGIRALDKVQSSFLSRYEEVKGSPALSRSLISSMEAIIGLELRRVPGRQQGPSALSSSREGNSEGLRPLGRPLSAPPPAVSAVSMMDPGSRLAKEDQALGEIAESLFSRASSIVGRELDRPVVADLYRACVDAYAEAVRVHLRSGRKPPGAGMPSRPDSLDRAVERQVRRDFLSYETDCFFPGCEELRQERLDKIEQSGGSSCKSCTRTSINNEFCNRAVEIYAKWKAKGGGE
jgi:hypothetical protein